MGLESNFLYKMGWVACGAGFTPSSFWVLAKLSLWGCFNTRKNHHDIFLRTLEIGVSRDLRRLNATSRL